MTPSLRRRTLLAAAAGAALTPFLGAQAMAANPRIYLDPGHGGTDSGAVGNGLQEKALTLAIALQIRDILAAGDRDLVGVSRWTSAAGYVIADAVRVTRV